MHCGTLKSRLLLKRVEENKKLTLHILQIQDLAQQLILLPCELWNVVTCPVI